MSALTDLVARIGSLVRRDAEERELEEEMQFHLERDAAERVRRGATPQQAMRDARIALGVEGQKEAVRDARGVRGLQELGADLRLAMRTLGRSPSYTLTALLVLGLGLGATTAVFSVVHSVVLAPLPYPEPERLVRVSERNANAEWALSTADVVHIAESQRSFTAWGGAQRVDVELSGSGDPRRIGIGRVQSGYLAAIGVLPAIGRTITAADEARTSADVVVLTHALAQELFGGAERSVGGTITLDGVQHTVVGVFPPGREELGGLVARAWVPLKLPDITRRGPFWLRGVGRLAPGVTLEAAAADLAGASARLLGQWPDFRDGSARLQPRPLREALIGTADRQVWLFAGAVLIVLALSVVNVATLALVRAAAREGEIAVRAMLGARRGRLVRLLMTESLALTLGAGALGVVLSMAGVRLAARHLSDLPRIADVAVDWRAMLVALSASVVSGIVVSLSPLWMLRGRWGEASRGDARRAGTSRRAATIRAALVVTEFSLALPLLAGAGLLLNSFVRMQRVDPGFETDGLVSVGATLPRARYAGAPEIVDFWQRVEQRAAAQFGGGRAGLASEVPPDQSGNTDNFNLVRHPVPSGQAEPAVPWYYVTASYFDALGIGLVAGRRFAPGDTGSAAPVVIVSASWARRYLPGEDAVGQQLVQGGCYDCPRTTIVGVVRDVATLGPGGSTEVVYGPVGQAAIRTANLVVRAGAESAALRDARELLRQLDPKLPVSESIVSQRFDDALADPRRWVSILTAFAFVALALAALSVFGLMSYVVSQRRREIGVRLAIGARPSEITRFIVVRGMRHAASGSAIGLVFTLALANRLESMLFGVTATDATTMVATSLVLMGCALIASYLPARRAAQVRPVEAIAAE